MKEELREFCDDLQKRCLPGVWSKGVVLSRGDGWIEEKFSPPGEILYRLTVSDRTVSLKVSLWPEDLDAHCTCGDRNEICPHIAGAVILLKTGRRFEKESASQALTQIRYQFRSRALGGDLTETVLKLERELVIGGDKIVPLRESLVSVAGAISSGRYAWPPLAALSEDYRVDEWISRARQGEENIQALLRALSGSKSVFLDGVPVGVSGEAVRVEIRVARQGQAYALREVALQRIEREFMRGIVLVQGALGGTLRPIEHSEFFGRVLMEKDLYRLVTEIVPRLEKKFPVVAEFPDFPRAQAAVPKIVLESLNLPGPENETGIIPRIVYPAAIAFPLRDLEREAELEWELKSRHQLVRDHMVRLSGAAGVARVDAWKRAGLTWESKDFSVQGELSPSLEVLDQSGWSTGFNLKFAVHSRDGEKNPEASVESVFKAWRENASLVPLLGGGWAALPRDWLTRFGEQIESLWFSQNENKGTLPPVKVPELLTIATEGQDEALHRAQLSNRLAHFAEILKSPGKSPDLALPGNLHATLRDYQRVGVNWLSQLRSAGLGALLADDMGLGKTLQAICALETPALVVAPASVVGNWVKEIGKFRPDLKVFFYGSGSRKIAEDFSGVLVTTYGMLRSDTSAFSSRDWATTILDESQAIKNSESQTAQAAFQLASRSRFRIALTGTPIENRLADICSQFQFINPGLISKDDDLEWVRRRVRPFVLRRLKKDVALELPPRTESQLSVSLSEKERDFYQSLLASARAEVAEKLNKGEKNLTLQVLELLLRLRQVCCDAALVPGAHPDFQGGVSSKIAVLFESLEQSLALGHRALVFSQWTGLLDRVESELLSREFTFSRIDGSTQKRQDIVDAFQRPDGPQVMLISLKAGGVGLTLTAADHVYILDPWWNPAVEDQAADRVHRIGQTNPVFIQRLVALDTIEERIALLKQEKKFLAQAVLESPSATPGSGVDPVGGAEFTAEEILNLLS